MYVPVAAAVAIGVLPLRMLASLAGNVFLDCDEAADEERSAKDNEQNAEATTRHDQSSDDSSCDDDGECHRRQDERAAKKLLLHPQFTSQMIQAAKIAKVMNSIPIVSMMKSQTRNMAPNTAITPPVNETRTCFIRVSHTYFLSSW